jgi:hypothetical protein
VTKTADPEAAALALAVHRKGWVEPFDASSQRACPRERVRVPRAAWSRYPEPWPFACQNHPVPVASMDDPVSATVRFRPVVRLRPALYSDRRTDVRVWLGQCPDCGTIFWDTQALPAPCLDGFQP